MNVWHTLNNSIENLCNIGDITEQESDEIFSVVYGLYRYGLHVDKDLIAALKSWYDEVHDQLKVDKKGGNFITTIPLVSVQPEIDSVTNKCLELLPWYSKVCYAGLPANILPIDKLPGKPKGRMPQSFDTAEGIKIYQTNRRVNIIVAISDRAGLFQRVKIKVDLNKSIDRYAYSSKEKSSVVRNWWEYYFCKKNGNASGKVFLPSRDDLWFHAIMKIAEQLKIKLLFLVTCDGKTGVYINGDEDKKLRPYSYLEVSFHALGCSESMGVYDESVIDKAAKSLEKRLKIELEKEKLASEWPLDR